MFAGLVPKGLNCHILTLYAGGDESRPRYREAIVIKLQLLHQRNIILYNTHTHNGVKYLDFLLPLCLLLVSLRHITPDPLTLILW